MTRDASFKKVAGATPGRLGSATPYLVRWKDSGESVFFPSSGTVVEHRPLPAARQAP